VSIRCGVATTAFVPLSRYGADVIAQPCPALQLRLGRSCVMINVPLVAERVSLFRTSPLDHTPQVGREGFDLRE
jgi:hypothetical protein